MNIKQTIREDTIIGPEDIATAAETSAATYVDIRGKGKSLAVRIHAKLTATKTAVCELTCATNAGGTNKADVSGKTVTLTGASGGSSPTGMIWFEPADLDLDNSKYFVGVDITTNQNGDNIEASLLSIPDYLHDAMNT